jgi:aconitate hydratase
MLSCGHSLSIVEVLWEIRMPFGSLQNLETQQGTVQYYRLDQLEKEKVGPVSQLPVSIKILLEAALRNLDGFEVQEEDVRALANWKPKLESV